MSIVGFLRGRWSTAVQAWWTIQARRKGSQEIRPADWPLSIADPVLFYRRCFNYFHKWLPAEFKEHRAFFHNVPGDRRGFGEDAFHVLWYLLFEELRPESFLEIGVFRGQVISLAALWAKLRRQTCEVCGISPFSPTGDSVSSYPRDIDYYADTLANFDHLHLPHPRLVRACSSDGAALELIGSRPWDVIYIDGNHDYDIVRQDWAACSRAIRPGGVIVLDDAGLTTGFKPPAFATKGHPGPSRLAQEIDRCTFRELLQVGHNRAFQRMPMPAPLSGAMQ